MNVCMYVCMYVCTYYALAHECMCVCVGGEGAVGVCWRAACIELWLCMHICIYIHGMPLSVSMSMPIYPMSIRISDLYLYLYI